MFNTKMVEPVGDRNASPLKPAGLIALVAVCVTMATAEVFFGVDEPPPAPSLASVSPGPALTVAAIDALDTAAMCAASIEVGGGGCDYGLEQTATPTLATMPDVSKRSGSSLASARTTSVGSAKVGTSWTQQVNPENQTVGCGGGENASNDCK